MEEKHIFHALKKQWISLPVHYKTI